jgi:hypothetical protein
MALVSIRLVPLFAIVAIPVISRSLMGAAGIRRWVQPLLQKNRVTTVRRAAVNATLVLAVLLFAFSQIEQINSRATRLEESNFPIAAANFLATQTRGGCLFNHYYWGGYLIWRLYPQYRVGVDGRADLYGDEYLFRYVDTYRLGRDWRKHLAETKACAVIVPAEDPIAGALRLDAGWKRVFDDRRSVMYFPAGQTAGSDPEAPAKMSFFPRESP